MSLAQHHLLEAAELTKRKVAAAINPYFPENVRKLGQIWYKVRSYVPLFVRDLGQIWYKIGKIRISYCAMRAIM